MFPFEMTDIENAGEYESMSWMTVRENIEKLAKCHQISSLKTNVVQDLESIIDKQLYYSMEQKLITPPHGPFSEVIYVFFFYQISSNFNVWIYRISTM